MTKTEDNLKQELQNAELINKVITEEEEIKKREDLR